MPLEPLTGACSSPKEPSSPPWDDEEPVPFVDLHAQHAAIARELDAALHRVVSNGSFILGAEVAAFEAEFAAYCGVAHCVGVGSGTVALELALRAAGIEDGDEVIVPAHTYIASALAIVHAGATPVLCDVEDATGLLDPSAVEAAIGPRTTAIMPVHLYGQICDMQAIGEIADRQCLMVIEDAAQAHGATRAGRRAGSFGRAGCFSFYPSKNLGALGDGGAVCTNDGGLAERVRRMRHLGQRAKGEHLEVGYNERLDGLQAAFLRAKLPHLDGWNAARREHAHAYRSGLPSLRALGERSGSQCIYHVYPIRVSNREDSVRALADANVQTGVHYYPAIQAQPALASFFQRVDAPVARAWAQQELSLPMFAELTENQIARVVDACRGVAQSA